MKKIDEDFFKIFMTDSYSETFAILRFFVIQVNSEESKD